MLPDPAWRPVIERIHASPWRVVLAVTGGGSGAVAALPGVPGASRTLLEAVIPYSRAALGDWLRRTPDDACSAATARAMAVAAWRRARRLAAAEAEPRDRKGRQEAGDDEDDDGCSETLAGIGCTAGLATDRPRRGSHRVHVAAHTADRTVTWTLELEKGARDRDGEEAVAAALVLHALASTCGAGPLPALPLRPGEDVRTQRTEATPPVRALLQGRREAVLWRGAAFHDEAPAAGRRIALFPGAFNPLHDGHRRMAEVARRRLGREVEFELTVDNLDKPPLDYAEIDRRVRQFDEEPLWLTAAPDFPAKARLFPGCVFLVGTDTIRRIGEPRYYGGEAARDAALAGLAAAGCGFLVFGRMLEGDFCPLAALDLPGALRPLCEGVGEEEFRVDLSSTELRPDEPP